MSNKSCYCCKKKYCEKKKWSENLSERNIRKILRMQLSEKICQKDNCQKKRQKKLSKKSCYCCKKNYCEKKMVRKKYQKNS